MLLLRIDRGSPEPVYRQVARMIIELVEGEVLRDGEILPPTRELAASLSVSRFTVNQAYRELWAKGYVDARPGSYTRVRRRPRLARSAGAVAEASGAPGAAGPGGGGADGPRGAGAGAGGAGAGGAGAKTAGEADRGPGFPRYAILYKEALGDGRAAGIGADGGRPPDFVDFTALSLDERLFPVAAMRAAYARALGAGKARLLNYAESAGYRPLREYLASRMRAHCVEARPEEIVVTHGSLQGLELAARLFVDPGGEAVVEEPTFSNAIPLLRLGGARLASLPMGRDGADLDALESLVRRGERGGAFPSLLYSIPTFHNPTGVTSSQPHRERLLALCERGGFPLVEDSFQEEITYFGKAVLPVKSMDARGLVLYLGSFSKVLFPGARLGWIVAREDVARRLAAIKRVTDISCSPFAQAALLDFCESGAYDAHLRRINRVFAARMRLAVDALGRALPPGKASFRAPSGGYLIWIALETARSEAEILSALRARGVSAAPGSLFFARPPERRFLRLSISALDEEEIEAGAARLGAAIESL